MTRSSQRILAAGGLVTGLVLCLVGTVSAEEVWVRDEIRLNIRTGPSTQNRIVGVAKTGDGVDVLKQSDGWTKIRVIAKDKTGWIPDGYLQPEPPPGIRLAAAESEAAKLEKQLDSLRDESEKLRRDNSILSGQDGEQQAKIKELSIHNMELRAGARYPEWITGACIFAAGMVLGAWLHRNSSRRQPTRIRL